jgi:hypothetical protein
MATVAKFARLAHYSREFGEGSHIFIKNGIWRMLASLASRTYFRKTPFWRMRVLTKSAEIFASTCKISSELPLLTKNAINLEKGVIFSKKKFNNPYKPSLPEIWQKRLGPFPLDFQAMCIYVLNLQKFFCIKQYFNLQLFT